MLIGANPRREAAVLNARIRKRYRSGNVLLGLIGEKADLTYPYNYLGAGPESLAQFVEHAPAQKEKPMFIIGQGALKRPDGAAVLAMAAKAARSLGVVKDGWNGFSILHTRSVARRRARSRLRAGRGRRWIPAACSKAGALDVLFLLGVDEIEVEPGAFVVYIGTHGDRGAHRADVILPGAAYPEKSGDLRQHRRPRADGERAPPSRRATRARTGRSCARCRTRSATRCRMTRSRSLRQALFAAHPHLMRIDQIAAGDAADIDKLGQARRQGRQGAVHDRGSRLLSHQSDRARLRHHGRMFGAGERGSRRRRRSRAMADFFCRPISGR